MRSCENVVGLSIPTIVPLLGQFPVLTRLSGNGKGKNGVPAEVTPDETLTIRFADDQLEVTARQPTKEAPGR